MYWCLLVFLFFSFSALQAQNEITVDPEDTSPGISEPFEPHFIYLDTNTTLKNQLFVFFPGTGGSPTHYKLILQHAASLGFHSIGLSYPNPIAINSAQVCGLSLNPECHGDARMEIFDGIDRHPNIDVDSFNSIQNRLFALLNHLDANYPNKGWGNFYQDEEISWDKVKVAGHSQGGGHAGFIATFKPVERAIMISSNDRLGLLNQPAGWMTNQGITPTEKYFGFIHGTDELVDFEQTKVGWSSLGLDNAGPLVLIDTINPPFENTRQLYTLLDARLVPGKHHGMTAVDIWTPRENDNSPTLAEVWTYMIEHPTTSVEIYDQLDNQNCYSVYPNPTKGLLHIQNFDQKEDLIILDSAGNQVRSISIGSSNTSINISDLPSGIYFLVSGFKCQVINKICLISSR